MKLIDLFTPKKKVDTTLYDSQPWLGIYVEMHFRKKNEPDDFLKTIRSVGKSLSAPFYVQYRIDLYKKPLFGKVGDALFYIYWPENSDGIGIIGLLKAKIWNFVCSERKAINFAAITRGTYKYNIMQINF